MTPTAPAGHVVTDLQYPRRRPAWGKFPSVARGSPVVLWHGVVRPSSGGSDYRPATVET
jgi:hypothetical protein